MLSKVWLGNSCRLPLRAIKCRSGIPPILYALVRLQWFETDGLVHFFVRELRTDLSFDHRAPD
jgi:hypothetical protein